MEDTPALPYLCAGNRRIGRERDRSLLLLSELNMEHQLKAIELKIAGLLKEDPSYFLVEAKINTGNNVKVFIDADDGASIDKLVKYNRSLYRHIEEIGLFPNGDFSLEVSSAGLDEPLKLRRQYLKNIGRDVEVVQKDGIKSEGKLVSVNENEIVIEEEKVLMNRSDRHDPDSYRDRKGRTKKKEVVQHTILIKNIKNTKIQVRF